MDALKPEDRQRSYLFFPYDVLVSGTVSRSELTRSLCGRFLPRDFYHLVDPQNDFWERYGTFFIGCVGLKTTQPSSSRDRLVFSKIFCNSGTDSHTDLALFRIG